jgi:adenosylcobinamide-GDP ribazoletransferase
MIRTEIRYFLTALMFFTRVPCPSWTDHSPRYMNKSRKYFPLIGWIVGGLGAAVFAGSYQLLPTSVSLILSMVATVWVTGAFHEDGFADVCDGFGGGWTKEQIIRIMKDSRIGAYGMIGMALLLLLKFFALYELALKSEYLVIVALVNGHIASRFLAETTIFTHTYVQESIQAKSANMVDQKLTVLELTYSFLFLFPPLLLFFDWRYALTVPVAYLGKIYLAYYFNKKIGGYTGDCLGAIQQLCECLFYLAVLCIHPFIPASL